MDGAKLCEETTATATTPTTSTATTIATSNELRRRVLDRCVGRDFFLAVPFPLWTNHTDVQPDDWHK